MPEQVAELSEIFADQAVVVSGGASGIGLATAHMVVDRGGRVILIGRSLERLKAAQEELGPVASIIPLDVTDEDAVWPRELPISQPAFVAEAATAACLNAPASPSSARVSRFEPTIPANSTRKRPSVTSEPLAAASSANVSNSPCMPAT